MSKTKSGDRDEFLKEGQIQPEVNKKQEEIDKKGREFTPTPPVMPTYALHPLAPRGDIPRNIVDLTLDDAFAVIREHLDKGHDFTNDQKDLGIKLSLNAIPDSERQWFIEIGDMNGIPTWQVLWGQWRRANDQGTAAAPLCDPDWVPVMKKGLTEKPCDECGTMFLPTDPAQRFHSNRCGAEAERRARAEVQPKKVEEIIEAGEVSTPVPSA